MFRWLAIFFLLLGLTVLAADTYLTVTGDGVFRLHALGEWWSWIHLDSLLLLQPAVERHLSPALWDPGIQTVLEWPAVIDFSLVAAIFWLLGRRRRRRRDNLRFDR